ncbi:hypothetical protein PRZ48_011003 [Zasmidium cellare]|uniref:Sequence orphan n=1 Tax=Zasmidium cellare TaxID=395010 RepID=A0ABR0EB28_ZASCE|nr:hypothetical protein PRZ48_011003 [Zasmidium cellare]
MTLIDRAVTESAAGHTSIASSVRESLKSLARQPQTYLFNRPMASMFLLYSLTYLTANTVDTLSSYSEDLPASSTTSSTTKFAAVTAVNVGLALYKDATFARSFGSPGSKLRALPASCYVPFIVRDGITLGATFNVPAAIAPSLPEGVEKYMSRLSVAQLAAPAASQFLCTPLHLYGLDLYYRGGKLALRERFEFVRRMWWSSSVARACRVIPAYGLGGVLNNDARKYMMEKIE